MTPHDHLPELPCRDFVEVVTSYFDDSLSPDERRRFEAHLAACESCDMYMDQIRDTIALTGRTPRPDELPLDLREGLRHAFRHWAA